MLNIERIQNGIIIDHIKAGQGMKVFNWLGLDKRSYSVAFVINAFSTTMELHKKDFIKIDTVSSGSIKMIKDGLVRIDNTIDIDINILGFIDPNITVRIITDGAAGERIHPKLPDRIENVLHCNNPRCVTYTEKYIPQIFILEDEEARTYRCEYCDDIRNAGDIKKPKQN
jgi:aspartate carbamoyltransferase regulatory subunit